MAKIIGYIIAIIGLAILALSKTISSLPFMASIEKSLIYTIIGGIVLIVLGLVFVISKAKPKQAKEVPIYEGEGKKRKIIGYRKLE